MSLDLEKCTWKRVRLGDVIQRSREQVDPTEAGVTRYVAGGHIDGDSLTIDRWGHPSDGQMGSTFRYVFGPGQVLFVSARPYLRKSGVVDFSGVVADKTYVLDAIPENGLLQEFLPFLLASEPFVDYATAEATGSMNPRLLWGPFQRYEFDLPPLDEQKRIADLLWAIERHKLALGNSVDGAREALARVTAARFAAMPTRARLGDLATTRSGPSFAASDVHDTPVPESVPVLGIPNTKPDGTINLEGVGYVTGLPSTVGRVDEGSLILIRTNGNRQRIGNVYLPPVEALGHAVSAFQFLMQVNEPEDRKYLFWLLNESGMQERMSDGASGTVGLGNLAVRWLNEQQVPWSADRRERRALAEELQDLSGVLDALRIEIAAASSLSRSVLAEIFGGI